MSESNRPVIRYRPGFGKGGSVVKIVLKPLVRPKRRAHNAVDDTSPYHVRRMRAALCDEFIATGVMNADLMAQLRAYAESKREGRSDARRRSKNDPV